LPWETGDPHDEIAGRDGWRRLRNERRRPHATHLNPRTSTLTTAITRTSRHRWGL